MIYWGIAFALLYFGLVGLPGMIWFAVCYATFLSLKWIVEEA